MDYRKKAQELTEARIQLRYAWDRAHGRITLLTTVFAMDTSLARSFARFIQEQNALNEAYFRAALRNALRRRRILRFHNLLNARLGALLRR